MFVNFLRRISFSRPDYSREAFEAYFHKLPSPVQVSWFRDGKYIVGRIIAGDHELMTQGQNAEEFIEMVNDAVHTAFDIPEDYKNLMRVAKPYNPPEEDRKRLGDRTVNESAMSLQLA